MPLDLPVIPEATVLRSATTTSVTPRWVSAQAAAAPSMPPPTMTTSAVSAWLTARFPSGNPVGAGQRHPGHRRRLDGDRDEVLGFEVAHVRLAAGARDGLGLHGQHPQVVGQPPAALDRVEPRGQFGILRADARRVACRPGSRRRSRPRCPASRTRRRSEDGCRPTRSARRCRSRRRRRPAPAPWRRRRRCGCRRRRSAAPTSFPSLRSPRRDARPAPASACTACGTAASVGMPTCSMNTSWVAAVPPCMPSTTTTSAPAWTASFTS